MRSTAQRRGDDREALLAFGFAHDVQRGAQDRGGPVDQPAGEAGVGEDEPDWHGQVHAQQGWSWRRRGRGTLAASTTTTMSRPNVSVAISALSKKIHAIGSPDSPNKIHNDETAPVADTSATGARSHVVCAPNLSAYEPSTCD